MAKKKDTTVDMEGTVFAPSAPERVELKIPKGAANDDPNYFIGINGVNYILPRGKTSMVPPEVKAEYERAERAQEKMDERIDALLKAAKQSI